MNAYAPAIVGLIAILAALFSVLWIASRPPAKIREQRRLLRKLAREDRGPYARRLMCRLRGHAWAEHEPYKRKCAWCGKRETLFENRYPHIGEPKYEWR